MERKKKLPFPCNLDESEKKYPHVNNKKQLGQFPCWFEYTLSSWLVLNKLKNNTEIFVGSCFNLKNNFKFTTGTSTRKFDQNTSQDIIKTILGSTGFGFIYGSKQIVVQYGIYYYGVGASVNGLNIGVYF